MSVPPTLSLGLSNITRKPDPEGYIPLADTHSRESSLRLPNKIARSYWVLTFASIVVLIGTLLSFTFVSFGFRPGYVSRLPPSPVNPPMALPDLSTDCLSLEEIRCIVARGKGYWARDYSLHLGWNNMRYIIETALLHGALLNRTVIIPSFVYARSCEFSVSVCASHAEMVSNGKADLPIEEQVSWRLPISVMLNMTLLRSTQPVITVSEYLRLHNIPEHMEESDGHWGRQKYHVNPSVFTDTGRAPGLHVIENELYDSKGINRVDVIPDDMKKRGGWSPEGGDYLRGQRGMWLDTPKTIVYRALQAALPESPRVLEWDRVRQILEKAYSLGGHVDDEMERILRENGWEVLYTYNGVAGMDFMKHVVYPIRQAAPRDTLRGLQEDYGYLTADVVLLAGEVHLWRKPGSLRFTTVTSRDLFSCLVLYHVRATNNVYELAARLAARMKQLTGGRMWLAAHMRRGDFIRTTWVMENTLEAHLSRIQDHLAIGRNVLRSLRTNDLRAYDVPDVIPDRTVTQFRPPEDTDVFYISTDERDPGNITYLTNHGAIMTSSLLTIDDRRAFGWPIMLTDVVGLVEQAVLAHAYYFYAHAMSSYAGGVINMRAAAGQDPRTAFSD